MSKKNNKEAPLNEDFKNVMDSVSKMDSTQFAKTLEEERKKMLSLKKQYPNNPLFSQMDSEDFNISQDEFVDMCKLIMTGNMSDTLSEAFNFMGLNNEGQVEKDTEGCLPSDDSDNENEDDIIKETPQG